MNDDERFDLLPGELPPPDACIVCKRAPRVAHGVCRACHDALHGDEGVTG